ncbi:MAG: hypothetical protein K8W52_27735 [Deltaproteobacteria bacterium]|nr:hypothetical protein [Deltaproteobacteria bacterium]
MADDPVPTARLRADAPSLASASAPPAAPLYSPGQVAAATFFGTPLAGAWLFATNERRCGHPGRAAVSLVVGTAATALLVMLALAVSTSIPRLAGRIAILPVLAMGQLARVLQGKAYAKHLGNSGRRAPISSVIAATGVGLALGVGVAYATGYAYLSATAPARIEIGGSEFLYADGVTEREAQAVGDALQAIGMLSPKRPLTVVVRRDHGRVVVGFTMPAGPASHPEIRQAYRNLAVELSHRAFDDAPVDVAMLDPQGTARVTLAWEGRPQKVDDGLGQPIEFRPPATEAEARAVGVVLRQANVRTADHPASLVVRRDAGRPVVELEVDDAVLDDTATQTRLHATVNDLSALAFSGAPVDLWLDDHGGAVRVKLTWETRPQP